MKNANSFHLNIDHKFVHLNFLGRLEVKNAEVGKRLNLVVIFLHIKTQGHSSSLYLRDYLISRTFWCESCFPFNKALQSEEIATRVTFQGYITRWRITFQDIPKLCNYIAYPIRYSTPFLLVNITNRERSNKQIVNIKRCILQN